MSGERRPGRFERALRLTLDLHELIETGQDESEQSEKVRDELDKYFGWSGTAYEDCLLSSDEKKILDQVSVALNGDT